MKKILRQIADFPFHPFLLASYFFIHLYASNVERGLTFGRLAKPYGMTLVIAAAGWAVLALIFKNIRRGAVPVSLGVFIFFTAGYLHGALEKRIPIPEDVLMSMLIAGWLAFSFILWKDRIHAETWTARANGLALVLLIMPLSSAALYHLHHKPAAVSASVKKDAPLPARQWTPRQLRMPDVYYIILDEYAHHDVLMEVFNYDNTWFLDELRKMGFYIADHSHCNYMRTILSVPSSLSMTYLDAVTQKEGPDSKDTSMPFAMVRGNTAARMFKRLGYQYLMTDSGESPLDNSPLADKVFSYTGTDEFTALLAKGTLIKGAANDFIHDQQRNRHFFNFKAIETIPDIPGPKFSFLHFNMPHPPFVFDRDGNPSKARNYDLKPNDYGPEYQKFYLDQLIYTSKVTLDLVRKILAKSKNPPIIIIQSDHGLSPNMTWENSEAFVRQRGQIINAYLVPPVMREKLYPSITPVNTFRLLFKTVFGAPVDLLEDRTYYSHYENHPYVFTDVTYRYKPEVTGPRADSPAKVSAKS